MSFDKTSIGIFLCLEERSLFIKDFIKSLSLAANDNTHLHIVDIDSSSDIDENILEMIGDIQFEDTKEEFVSSKGKHGKLNITLTKMCKRKKDIVKNYYFYEYMTNYDLIGFFESNVVFYPEILKKAASLLNNDSFIFGSCYFDNDVLTKSNFRYTNYQKSFTVDTCINTNFFINKLAAESIKPVEFFQKQKNPISIIGENFLCYKFYEKGFMVKEQ